MDEVRTRLRKRLAKARKRKENGDEIKSDSFSWKYSQQIQLIFQ